MGLDLPPAFRRRGLARASAEHGGFALTEKGEAILRGREGFMLRADAPREKIRDRKDSRPAREAQEAGPPKAKTGFSRRCESCGAKSPKDRGVAAYMVFADRTLLEMAARRPATLDELRGHPRRRRPQDRAFGEVFLEAIAQACA